MPSAQTLPNTKISWLRRIFAGNGLLWALYFVLVLVSLYTVSSALSSEIYKSLSVGRLNPILKHALMLAIGICSAILLSRCSGRFYRYTLPPLSALLMVGLFFAHSSRAEHQVGRALDRLGLHHHPARRIPACLYRHLGRLCRG